MDSSADVLIIGTGVAGMYAALNLDKNLNIIMISKSKVDECNSYLAQGGVSTARNKEDIECFVEDTLKAGEYKNDVDAVRVLASESIENIQNLVKLGVKFDKNEEGFDYTREGAHRINRIVHCADETGKKISEVLLKRVKERKNIHIYENSRCIDVISKDNNCYGAVILKNGNIINVYSKFTILACGGIGGLFKNSTNQRTLTADGIAIALRNNIELKDINYIQFHPTGLYENQGEGKKFLISESLRGEGAKLVNNKGKRFIDELLPRNVVSKAILQEEKKTNSKCVFLDTSKMSKEFLVNRFPLIYSGCKERNIDITKQNIPVTPVQHYFMGGIKVDTDSKTSMKNLFACGEVSCTGVHGANRLASNSLLEALVFSKRAAKVICKNIDNTKLEYLKNNLTYMDAIEIMSSNKKAVLNEFIKLRGDIKNELVSC